MRVVAGSAKGTTLQVPKTDLRPTMDLVKSAIFSSLHDLVTGGRILDLFAGTGSLGIEALSRGAASAVFVESDAKAIKTIEQNLAKTRLQGTVHAMDIFSYLDRLARPASFDLIIADPPYAKQPGERDFAPELLASEGLRRALADGGIFVLEHLPGADLGLEGRWDCLRQKRYGATEVAFLRPIASA
ncbi:MAG TPA: 16S rRNA (guanine(966)-N(2))-methyltransferase RsmD [Chthoniobacteraceae bacterium]|jgi:16S rRNA (guanine966-N2)-methyltransferase